MTATATVTPRRAAGFTLVELLIALAVMAMLAMLSWQGLDTMSRTQTATRERADQVLALQAGLNQWGADLEAVLQVPQLPAIDWDGRCLRIIRRSTEPGTTGLWVVAWTRREVNGVPQWLRWQSPALSARGELADAWQRAATWAQNPSTEDRKREVAVTPLADWRIFYYRSDAWTNPLSSGASTIGTPAAAAADANLPDGVRLVLTLPAGMAITGTLTRDWIRPTQGGGKS